VYRTASASDPTWAGAAQAPADGGLVVAAHPPAASPPEVVVGDGAEDAVWGTATWFGSRAAKRIHAWRQPSSVRGKRSAAAAGACRSQMPK